MEWFVRSQEIASDRHFFNWELEFPEAFFEGDRGFDAIVGNPPYVSVTNIDVEIRGYLLRRFETASGRFDFYIVFDERVFSLLRTNGILGFIQPIKFAIYANGNKLRNILLESMQIEQIVDVSQCRVFPDPTTYPCLLIVKKCKSDTDHKIIITHVPPDSPEAIINSRINIDITKIPSSRFRETPENVFCLRLSDDLWYRLAQINQISLILGDLFRIEQCIRIGSKMKRSNLVLDEVCYSSAAIEIKTACRKMLDGENLRPYSIDWNGHWLHYLPDELYNPKSLDLLDSPKILVKRIASSLTAVSDKGENGEFFYPLNTIYALISKAESGYLINYIVSLLNSKFLDWYYKLLFEAIAIRGGYIEYREYLKYLPIRRINFTSPEDERTRLVSELKDLYAAGRFEEVLSMVDECLPKDSSGGFVIEKEKSDVVHDLLAYLAEEMIEMNKEKQGEIRGFLAWLRGDMGAEVDDLSNKTKIQEYYQNGFSDLLKVLKANKRKLKTDYSARRPQERLKEEFEASIFTLTSLLARIRETDEVIDQVVYKLYGLTEEEIKIIDNANPK